MEDNLSVTQISLDVVLPQGWEAINKNELMNAISDIIHGFGLSVVGSDTEDMTDIYKKEYPLLIAQYKTN